MASKTSTGHQSQTEDFDLSLLSDEELIEYNNLLSQQIIDNRWAELRNPSDTTPKNYSFIHKSYYEQKYNHLGDLVSGHKGVVLEGSARSAKTFSSLKFIVKACLDSDFPLVVNIIKETYNNHKTTIYKDLNIIFEELGITDNPFSRLKDVQMHRLGKSQIFFLGADDHSKVLGNSADIVYINEALGIDFEVYRQSVMRCKFFIIDYNPSVTEHWIYDNVIPRDDVGYLRTTFRDNPLIPQGQKVEILAYEPWESGTYEVRNETDIYYNDEPVSDTNQPPPHTRNIANGTADAFMWMVYGLGLRGAMTGVIFKDVRWITREQCPAYGHIYANDFGFATDPNVLCRYWETDRDIYIEPLTYMPIDNPDDLAATFEAMGVEKDLPVICDSSDKYTGENKGTVEMVKALREYGYKAFKVGKTKSVMHWLGTMKKKRIHVVKNHLYEKAKKEQENYRYKEINGIAINQPIDKHNHLWDAARYGHIAHNNPNMNLVAVWD